MSGVAVSYAEGFSLGVNYFEVDRANNGPTDAISDDLRADAREAREDPARSWWAFKLGIARGYRSRLGYASIHAMKNLKEER